MAEGKPKLFFSTQTVATNAPLLDLDRNFMRYSIPLPGFSRSELEQTLNVQYHQLKTYLKHREPLYEVCCKNNEKQKADKPTSVILLRRYQSLCKVKGACEIIASELSRGAYERCVVFAFSHSVITAAKIYLAQFRPAAIFAGSNPVSVERHLRSFQGDKRRVLIVNIQAGFGLNLDCAQHVFFIEESMHVGSNLKALRQVYGPNQAPEVYVRNFCTNDELDIRVSELLRFHMMIRIRGEPPLLPEEYL